MYDREALLAAVDLAELADDLLGAHSGTTATAMWTCPNPNHAQTGRTPPLSIFNSHRGEQRWRCHGCGDGGTAIDLVLTCRNCTTRDALDYLAARVGLRECAADWSPTVRPNLRPAPVAGCRDKDGLQRYVDACAERLWSPEGRTIRHWLTTTRGLPDDVLAKNRIGAELGCRTQTRPDGMPRAFGAVLPVIADGQATYAQIRVPHPTNDRPRYLNPRSTLASNPRLTRIRPTECLHPEVVVTEGAIDALSAAAAGYRTVGLLSATHADEAVAIELSRLPHPIVLALDPDDAGRTAAARLGAMLEARGRTPITLDLGDGDLNDAMRRSTHWPTDLGTVVEHARSAQQLDARGVG